MNITQQFEKTPDKQALIVVETGEVLTYRDLEMGSRRLAWKFEQWGFEPGERIAIFMDNRPEVFIILWAGLRMGLRIVPINRFLKTDEVAFIIEDSDARAVFTSDILNDIVAPLPGENLAGVEQFITAGDAPEGFSSLNEILASGRPEPSPERPLGATMFYTSGTTGRPKGTFSALSGQIYQEGLGEMASWLDPMMNFKPGDSFFIAAPYYHTATCSCAIAVQAVGGTLLMMKKFDAASALAAMQQYRITHGYLVPTMFVRMLKLPEAERAAFDPSAVVCILHTGEPCSPDVKLAMIEWWGPKFIDMYGASELPMGTLITSEESLRKPGSVGLPFDCTIHITDDEGNELPAGEIGTIYFEPTTAPKAVYHKHSVKKEDSLHARGWISVGDVGYLDEDGYLFLTDRKNYIVISGGVNIYPRESEIALLAHPDVLDVVSFGLPDPDMGERLVSVVEAVSGVTPDEDLAQRIIAHCRAKIAHYKCPKEIFFEDELPRLPTGKIYKNVIRDEYLARTSKKT